jgi:hypothetical protein
MVLMLFQLPGTRPYASGSFLPVLPLVDLSVTPTTSSPFPSPPITDKLFPAQEIALSSCGTHLAIASSPLPRRDTPSGFLALDSARTRRTLLLLAAVGTSLLRLVQFLLWLTIWQACKVYMMLRNYKVFATSELGNQAMRQPNTIALINALACLHMVL